MKFWDVLALRMMNNYLKEGEKMSREAVIVSAVRTAIGRMGGTLATIPIHEFGAVAIKEAIKRVNLDVKMIDDVTMGNVLSGGEHCQINSIRDCTFY